MMSANTGGREGKDGCVGWMLVGREWRSEMSLERTVEIVGSGQLQKR